MSFRIFSFPLAELIIDADAIAAQLTHACHARTHRYRLTCVCQSETHAIFPGEEVPASAPAMTYVIVPIEADTTEQIAAELQSRWASGFVTLGVIYLPKGYLAVYAKPA
jgi:hypothetical protein